MASDLMPLLIRLPPDVRFKMRMSCSSRHVQAGRYWLRYHTIVINANVMCLSVDTLLAGYLIGNSSAVHAASRDVLGLIPAVLGVARIEVTLDRLRRSDHVASVRQSHAVTSAMGLHDVAGTVVGLMARPVALQFQQHLDPGSR